jgi:hypothetical protein
MRAAAAMIALLLPVPVLAQDADRCWQSVVAQDLRIEVTGVRDVGHGFVQEMSRESRRTSGAERISFQHCASGQTITAVMSTWDENGSPLAPANPHDIMMMAMESSRTFAMGDVVAQMTAAGVDARLFTTTVETCGCALFYPEARGDKTAWSP